MFIERHTDLTVMSLFASSLDDHQKAKGNPKLEVFGSSGKGSLLHLFGIYARTVTLGVLRGVLFWLVWYFVYVVFKHATICWECTKQSKSSRVPTTVCFRISPHWPGFGKKTCVGFHHVVFCWPG